MNNPSNRIKVNGGISLEAVFHPAPHEPKGGLLALHPHPLYGGTMDDAVVMALMDAAAQEGWAGLRFNFRGVGGSGGRHDQGRGEQDDAAAAWEWLRQRINGPLVLSGYSFGAIIASQIASRADGLSGGILVSPPTMLGQMGDWPPGKGELLVVAGDRDQYGPSAPLQSWYDAQSAPVSLELVEGQDHFWYGKESVLIENAAAFLRQVANGVS